MSESEAGSPPELTLASLAGQVGWPELRRRLAGLPQCKLYANLALTEVTVLDLWHDRNVVDLAEDRLDKDFGLSRLHTVASVSSCEERNEEAEEESMRPRAYLLGLETRCVGWVEIPRANLISQENLGDEFDVSCVRVRGGTWIEQSEVELGHGPEEMKHSDGYYYLCLPEAARERRWGEAVYVSGPDSSSLCPELFDASASCEEPAGGRKSKRRNDTERLHRLLGLAALALQEKKGRGAKWSNSDIARSMAGVLTKYVAEHDAMADKHFDHKTIPHHNFPELSGTLSDALEALNAWLKSMGYKPVPHRGSDSSS